MVQPQQPGPLIDALSRQLGVGRQELEEGARKSRLGQAAQIAALQDGCNCRACRLLRQMCDGLVDDALKEVALPPAPAAPVPVEG